MSNFFSSFLLDQVSTEKEVSYHVVFIKYGEKLQINCAALKHTQTHTYTHKMVSQNKHSSTSSPAPIATKHPHYIQRADKAGKIQTKPKKHMHKLNQLQIQQWFVLILIYSMLN